MKNCFVKCQNIVELDSILFNKIISQLEKSKCTLWKNSINKEEKSIYITFNILRQPLLLF